MAASASAVSKFVERYFTTLIFLAAVAFVFFYLSGNQREGCQRGNVVRTQLNVMQSTQASFLLTAAQTREDTAQQARDKGDAAGAKTNQDAADAYRLLIVPLVQIPLADC